MVNEQTFLEFSVEKWGPNWAIARKAAKNLARYGRCITRTEYNTARKEWEQAQ